MSFRLSNNCLSNNCLSNNYSNCYSCGRNYLGNELNDCEDVWMLDDLYNKNINNSNGNININIVNNSSLFTMYC